MVAAAAPQALELAGMSLLSAPLSGANASRLAPARTWTVEAWAAPSGGAEARLVSYSNGPATVLGGVAPAYFLGTTGSPSLEFEPYTPSYPFDSAYVNVPASPAFNLADAQAVTWEAWIKPSVPPPPGLVGCVLQGQDTVFPAARLPARPRRGARLTFGFGGERWLRDDVERRWRRVAVTAAERRGVVR